MPACGGHIPEEEAQSSSDCGAYSPAVALFLWPFTKAQAFDGPKTKATRHQSAESLEL